MISGANSHIGHRPYDEKAAYLNRAQGPIDAMHAQALSDAPQIAPRESELADQCAHLEREMCNLRSTVDYLIERLQPVIRPVTAAEQSDKDPGRAMSPLGIAMHQRTRDLAVQVKRLQMLAEALAT